MNRPTRRIAAVIAALATIAIVSGFAVTPGASAATGDFVIDGLGFGHGAGMSQWGAWQQAREGRGFEAILDFYYPGTTLTKYESSTTVNVRLTRSSDSSYAYYRVDLCPVVAPATLVMHDSAGDHEQALAVGTTVQLLGTGGKVQVVGTAGAFDQVELRPATADGRVGTSLWASSSTTAAYSNQYWGIIRVRPSAMTSLRVSNIVALDPYVRGVSEIDPGWANEELPAQYAPEAVKAQQTAARTYAMAKGGAEMYDNTRDQVYGGYNYAVSHPGVWEATDATAGMVLTLNGRPINAYFSTHNGGYITNTAWSDNAGLSYLVSKADPWSTKAPVAPWTMKPGYPWSYTFSPETLASKLGTNVGTITKIRVSARDTADPKSHARTLEITGTSGSTTMTARTFRSLLGLKSTLIVAITGGSAVAPGLSRYEQTSGLLAWTGTWSNFYKTGPSGGSYKRANTRGASCTVTFSGTYLAWIATEGTTLGRAYVSLDGGTPKLVDLARPSTMYQQTAWNTGTLTSGTHKVRIWWDEKNLAGKYISIDAFDVKGTLIAAGVQPALTRYQQSDGHLAWTGTWSNFYKAGPSGGSYKRANTRGASCTVTFSGTYLAWIATKGTTLGKAYVSLDGGTPKLVDLALSSVKYQQTVWNTGTLTSGTHKVKIWWYEKNLAGKYISVDAFDVKGTLK